MGRSSNLPLFETILLLLSKDPNISLRYIKAHGKKQNSRREICLLLPSLKTSAQLFPSNIWKWLLKKSYFRIYHIKQYQTSKVRANTKKRLEKKKRYAISLNLYEVPAVHSCKLKSFTLCTGHMASWLSNLYFIQSLVTKRLQSLERPCQLPLQAGALLMHIYMTDYVEGMNLPRISDKILLD